MREQLIQYVNLLFAGANDCDDIKQEILQNTLDRYDDLIAEGKVPEAAYRLSIAGIGDISEILGTPPQPTARYSHTDSSATFASREETDTTVRKLMRAIAVGLYILCPLPLILMSEFWGMDTLGLCGTLSLVAVATVLIILGGRKKNEFNRFESEETEKPRKTALQKSISSMVWAVGLALYLILSFSSGAWHLTWLIFPILGAVDSLLTALTEKRTDLSGIRENRLHRNINTLIWAMGLVIYLITSFVTGAWYITWLIFPITGAVQGLVRAILDLKEAMEHET